MGEGKERVGSPPGLGDVSLAMIVSVKSLSPTTPIQRDLVVQAFADPQIVVVAVDFRVGALPL